MGVCMWNGFKNSRPRVKRWTAVNTTIKGRALQLVANLDLLNGDPICIQLSQRRPQTGNNSQRKVKYWEIIKQRCEISALHGCYAAYSGQFLTDVSRQPIGHIYTGQEFIEEAWNHANSDFIPPPHGMTDYKNWLCYGETTKPEQHIINPTTIQRPFTLE
jgi:hypothetical protein